LAGIFVVEDIEVGTTLGECGFSGNSYLPLIADMSIMLVPAHHRCGYGSRILRVLFDLWTRDLGNPVCHATTWRINAAGNTILRSAGFTVVHQYIDARVGHQDVMLYERAALS
jgi:RimJ/RimL family protein N-acetyltransferase